MQIRRTRLLIIIILSILYYNVQGQTNSTDLGIPENLQRTKDKDQILLVGTKVFVSIPQGYYLRADLLRIEKISDPSTFFQFFESPTTSFTPGGKEVVKEKLQAMKTRGYKVYYEKEFKLDSLDAILVYGMGDIKTDQLSLNYGNSKYTITVGGQFSSTSKVDRDKILKSMLSSFVDESVSSDPSVLAKFSVDVSKSKFKLNSNFSQIFYYTIDGSGDPANNSYENQFMIVSMPSLENYEARKTYARSMLQLYEKNGISIIKSEEKEVQLNNQNAYQITFDGSVKGKSVKCYQVIIGDSNATILFCGMAYDRQEELFQEFIQIAQTLKIK